ncbi:metalloprotease TldD [Limnobacter humi]|uniref:Metalloprotease TldD n=1 Tax=Limnobacter humi TaxID=1778671 RepID=A0ABT1WKC5_9BURK|nr:metalloprotease TldD [Limnobacter humi]MCQ8896994.1 metalloprotease TldD [Limnobacter humi]
MNVVDPTIENLAIAQNLLWTPYGIDEQVVHKAFGEMFTHKVDFADLYFQYGCVEGWSLDEGIVKSGSYNIEQGVGVRAVSGEKTAFAYSDDIALKPILAAAKSVREIAALGKTANRNLKTGKGFTANSGLALYAPLNPIPSLSSTEKVALLKRLEQFARKRDPRVKQVMANIVGAYDVVLVARSDGVLAADVRPLVRVNVSVVVEHKGRRETGNSGAGGRFDFARFTDEFLQAHAHKAVDEALVNLEAKPAPAGAQTVVLGSGWPGILLHEAIGHGLEGDFNRKGSSAFSGMIGQRVAAKGVTIVDDGTLAGRRGSLNVDDEGNKTECTTLIEDGILKGYIQDITNARLMKMPVTGNGRRESFAHLPMPRMTNTYMLNGDKTPEEIIASVKDGVYAVNFGGGQVDITSGKFVFSASLAYKIQNGKITHPLKGATLIGNGPDSLTKISMVGNDMALDDGVGTCGKEGQSVPVGVGQPTLRIDGLVMGGTQ